MTNYTNSGDIDTRPLPISRLLNSARYDMTSALVSKFVGSIVPRRNMYAFLSRIEAELKFAAYSDTYHRDIAPTPGEDRALLLLMTRIIARIEDGTLGSVNALESIFQKAGQYFTAQRLLPTSIYR